MELEIRIKSASLDLLDGAHDINVESTTLISSTQTFRWKYFIRENLTDY